MEEDTRDVVRPYIVDGIEEYDNPLPPWWVWMFILTIAFGVCYLLYVHGFGWSSLEATLQEDRLAHSEFMKSHGAGASSSGELEARLKDPLVVAEGKVVFLANCAPCHGQNGEGVVGPNLTDQYWLHGGSPAAIVKLITEGVPEKGMLSWGPILGPKKIEDAAAYILSLQGSHPANAKAPQGEEYNP